jgi:hypothetical protein
MSEDGELTEKESGKDRDNNGRFLPGNKLGGRGLKKELSEAIEVIKGLLLDDDADLTSSKALDPLGRVLLHGITLKDPKVKNDSAKLYFAWITKMREAEEREKDDSSVSPEEVERFAEIVRMRAELDVIKSKEISDLLCSECKRKLGIDGNGLKGND